MTECIPSRNVTVRPDDKPWYDSELRHFTKCRDRLRKVALKTNSKTSWIKYKRMRNKENNLKINLFMTKSKVE